MTHMLLASQEAFVLDKTREEDFANSFLACSAPQNLSSSSSSTSSCSSTSSTSQPATMKFDFSAPTSASLPTPTSAAVASMFDFSGPQTNTVWSNLPPMVSLNQLSFDVLAASAFDAATAATMATPFGSPTDVTFEDELGDIKMLQEALLFEPAFSPMTPDELVRFELTPRNFSSDLKDIKDLKDEEMTYSQEMELIARPSEELASSDESDAETVTTISSNEETKTTPPASPMKAISMASPVAAPLIMPSAPAAVSQAAPQQALRRKPNARICRVENCTRGIRSRGLCKAHGGGRRCQTPGCKISDQGGGHCIAHGGGKRCSFIGCQKSAQSRGLCKLHGGGRKCKDPNCVKKSQHRGYCRAHAQMANLIPSKSAPSSPDH